MKQAVHKNLQHLTEQQINQLMSEYYNNEKINVLLHRYQINVRPSELVRLFPPQLIEGKSCPYCDSIMYVLRVGRSSTTSSLARCDCSHSDHVHCGCEGCVAQRKSAYIKEVENKVATIRAQLVIENRCSQKSPFELSLREAVFLLSLFFLSNFENASLIAPMEESNAQLSPAGKLDIFITDTLLESGLIKINPESKLDAFEVENGHVQYFPYKVSWVPIIGENQEEAIDYISTLLAVAKSGNWPASWYEEVEGLWELLSLYECLEILDSYSSQYGLEAPLSDRTKLIFKELLTEFPVAKLHYIVFKSVKDSVAFRAKAGLSKKHAENNIVSSCKSYAAKVKANNWTISSYRRDSNFPRSALSMVLHDIFLKHEAADEIVCQAVTPGYVEGFPIEDSLSNPIHLTRENCSSLIIKPDLERLKYLLSKDAKGDDESGLDEIMLRIAKKKFAAFEWILIASLRDRSIPLVSRVSMKENCVPEFLHITIDQEFLAEVLVDRKFREFNLIVQEMINRAGAHLKSLVENY